MLSIGEFSNICRVSSKTLRYYAEIGLITPDEINPENGYRYYSIGQLEKMLFINRLKSYSFSLEEIKTILESAEPQEEKLYLALNGKKKKMENKVTEFQNALDQLNSDLANMEQGRSFMSYLESIDVALTEIPVMYLLSIRKMVLKDEFPNEYVSCFSEIFRRAAALRLTMAAPPMVLFHSAEFSSFGMDTEFAVPVKEYATGTRDFNPGLCLKTILHGSYSNLPSVYARQQKWAEKEGYQNSNALFEVYLNNPSEVLRDRDLITEVYYPVKKI